MSYGLATKTLYTLLYLIPLALANSGFDASCIGIEISHDITLAAYCENASGAVNEVTLSLDLCLANVNGNLVIQPSESIPLT